jgi:hypothetical protein
VLPGIAFFSDEVDGAHAGQMNGEPNISANTRQRNTRHAITGLRLAIHVAQRLAPSSSLLYFSHAA